MCCCWCAVVLQGRLFDAETLIDQANRCFDWVLQTTAGRQQEEDARRRPSTIGPEMVRLSRDGPGILNYRAEDMTQRDEVLQRTEDAQRLRCFCHCRAPRCCKTHDGSSRVGATAHTATQPPLEHHKLMEADRLANGRLRWAGLRLLDRYAEVIAMLQKQAQASPWL